MGPDSSSPDSPVAPARRNRRYRLVAAGVVCLGLLAGTGWWWKQRSAPPQAEPEPPDFKLPGADPAVVEVIQRARQQVRRQPRSGPAWGRLAKLLLANSFPKEALTCLRRAEQLDPREPRWPYFQGIALLSIAPDDALGPFRRAVALVEQVDPRQTAPRLLLAELLLPRGDLDGAEAQLRAVARLDPDNPRLLYNFGLLARWRNDFRTARDYHSRLVTNRYTRQKAYRSLAMICQRLDEPAKAEEYDRLARRPPEDLPWADSYQDSFTQFDGSEQTRLRHAEDLEKAAKYGEAIDLLQELARQAGPNTDLRYVALANHLALRGRYDEAERSVRQALRLSPDSAQAHYTLGAVHLSQAEALANGTPTERARAREKYRQAADSARLATEKKSDYAKAYVLQARALYPLGRRAEAIAAARRAVKSRPESAVAQFFLGIFLAQDGKDAEALEHLELATQFASPSDLLPRAALERLRTKLGLHSGRPKPGGPPGGPSTATPPPG